MLFTESIGNGFSIMQIMPPAPISFSLFCSNEKDRMIFLSGEAARLISKGSTS